MSQTRDDTQESGYITPDQPGGIPGWREGIPVLRISTCGPFTIEMLVEVPNGAQARYAELPPERLSGRGPGGALKVVKLFLSQEGRYASKDWLRTHLREGQEVIATNKRLENILSYLRCHLLPLPGGKKLKDLITYRRATQESGDGYQLAGFPLVWIDIEALAWYVQQACLKERFGEDPLPYWERAYALASRGRFLVDEPTSEWAQPRREAVEDQVRQCVHALARCYLARFGQSGEEDVLRMLLPYCRVHRRDEDALRPLLELFCKRGRYQEVGEWYEHLEAALEEAGPDKTGAVRTPQPLTAEIADFARLKLREAIRTVEGTTPLNRSAASGSHLSASSLAHVVQLSQTQHMGVPGTVSVEQGMLVSSEQRALLPLALSLQLSAFNSASLDIVTWFGARVNDLKAFGTWHEPTITCQQQQTLIHMELEKWRVMTDQSNHDKSEYLISRRMALATLAALSSSLLTKMQYGPLTTIVIEEFLAESTTSVVACWHLLRGDGLATIEHALPKYLPLLIALIKQYPLYKKNASYLAAQCFLLFSLVALHRLHFAERVEYCKQAVDFARESGDGTLLVTSLTHLGDAFFTNGQRAEMLHTYQQAKYDSESMEISLFLRSKVLAELAHAYAQQGKDQEALRSVGEARTIFTEESSDTPVFLSTDYGLFQLILFDEFSVIDER